MEDGMSTAGMVHFGFAITALLAGMAIFTIAKGTRLHRALGYVYVASMIVLNVSGLTIYRLFGTFGPFHAFAIISLVTVIAGFLPVYLKRPRGGWLQLHYDIISWSYVGLLAAAASEVLTRVPVFDGTGAAFAAGVALASLLIFAVGGFLITRKRQAVIASVLRRMRAKG
jgi:uncharacterized membrane protein